MEQHALKAKVRGSVGSASARGLRRDGKVPAVLYRHGEGSVSLALAGEAVHEMAKSGQHLVTLDVDGKPERAIIKEIQWDTWGREILHVDFGRVALDELVNVTVEVVAHGTPKAMMSGAVLEQPLHSMEVACKADHIPDEIIVEVGGLEPGQMIHVKDFQLPQGVTSDAAPESIVFILQEPRAGLEEAEAAPEEKAAAEPEVIGRGAKEAEGEEAAQS